MRARSVSSSVSSSSVSTLIGMLCALTLCLPTPPASAATLEITDPINGPMPVGDISSVQITHSDRTLVVDIQFHGPFGPNTGTRADVYRIFIDTDAARPGPEYRYAEDDNGSPDSNVLERVSSFDSGPDAGQNVRCLDLDNGSDGDGAATSIYVAFPRGCLKTNGVRPLRVRVTVRTIIVKPAPGERTGDWAPRRKAFGRAWVAAG